MSDLENPFALYLERNEGTRTDLLQLANYENATDKPDAAMKLFWEFLYPTKFGRSNNPRLSDASSEPLDPDIYTATIEALRNLERRLRPPNQPDADPFEVGCDVHLLVAGTYGLFLARGEGFTEETRAVLEEALRSALKLGFGPEFFGADQAPAGVVLSWVVIGLVSFRLAEASLAEGSNEDALHHFANGFRSYASAMMSKDVPATELGIEDPESVKDEERWRMRFHERLRFPQLPASRVADAAINLANSPNSHHWAQLAEACEDIGEISEQAEWEGLPSISAGSVRPCEWLTFWLTIAGQLRGRLSPDQLRELLHNERRNAAEIRLTSYFFQTEVWRSLPEDVRKPLISADEGWCSKGPGRTNASINELRLAAEALCNTVLLRRIAVPATTREGNTSLLLRYAQSLQALQASEFDQLGCSSSEDKQFMSTELPRFLRSLVDIRNTIEHANERHSVPNSDKVTGLYKLALGIGVPGVLPRLAVLGARLAR